jgi:hypothetical protein
VALGVLTVAAILGVTLGRRLSIHVEDVSFLVLLMLAAVFVIIGWLRYGHATVDGRTARWRIWLSQAGCLTLSLAVGLPFIPFFLYLFLRSGTGPGWNYKMLMLRLGLAALLSGTVAAKGVRVPLIFGGLAIAIVGGVLRIGM